jgi:hypothetical protein
MAFALIDEQILGHARAEYIVCVNFFSLTLTIGLESGDVSSSFRRRLKPLQKKYRRNAFAALNHISMLSTPSLSLLQALLAGVSDHISYVNFPRGLTDHVSSGYAFPDGGEYGKMRAAQCSSLPHLLSSRRPLLCRTCKGNI